MRRPRAVGEPRGRPGAGSGSGIGAAEKLGNLTRRLTEARHAPGLWMGLLVWSFKVATTLVLIEAVLLFIASMRE